MSKYVQFIKENENFLIKYEDLADVKQNYECIAGKALIKWRKPAGKEYSIRSDSPDSAEGQKEFPLSSRQKRRPGLLRKT